MRTDFVFGYHTSASAAEGASGRDRVAWPAFETAFTYSTKFPDPETLATKKKLRISLVEVRSSWFRASEVQVASCEASMLSLASGPQLQALTLTDNAGVTGVLRFRAEVAHRPPLRVCLAGLRLTGVPPGLFPTGSEVLQVAVGTAASRDGAARRHAVRSVAAGTVAGGTLRPHDPPPLEPIPGMSMDEVCAAQLEVRVLRPSGFELALGTVALTSFVQPAAPDRRVRVAGQLRVDPRATGGRPVSLFWEATAWCARPPRFCQMPDGVHTGAAIVAARPSRAHALIHPACLPRCRVDWLPGCAPAAAAAASPPRGPRSGAGDSLAPPPRYEAPHHRPLSGSDLAVGLLAGAAPASAPPPYSDHAPPAPRPAPAADSPAHASHPGIGARYDVHFHAAASTPLGIRLDRRGAPGSSADRGAVVTGVVPGTYSAGVGVPPRFAAGVRRLRPGHVAVAINHTSVLAWGFEGVISALQRAGRPVLVTFADPSAPPSGGAGPAGDRPRHRAGEAHSASSPSPAGPVESRVTDEDLRGVMRSHRGAYRGSFSADATRPDRGWQRMGDATTVFYSHPETGLYSMVWPPAPVR